jgi:GWxTD domain-containing protein
MKARPRRKIAAMRTLAIVLLGVLTLNAFAADPGPSIARAKEELAAGNHAVALRLLREASAAAAAMTNLKNRAAALSAIHFYSAVASSAAGDREQAANELRSFFLYTPGGKLDASRYTPEFVTLFGEVHKKITQSRATPASFDDAYPGYPPSVSSSSWPLNTWGASSEFRILATQRERDEWDRLRTEEEQRAFVERFWTTRDPDPQTKVNEARIEFLHRIAFADVAFNEVPDGRGSLTDRGRVFVLLGPPQRVSIRPLTRREVVSAPRRTIHPGSAAEQWTYFHDSLPLSMPRNELVFSFVSTGGSLVRRLQYDFLTEKAMKDAPAALVHKQ